MLAALLRALGLGRERDDRRRYRRRRGGVQITVDGTALSVIDSSPGGFRAAGFAGEPPARGSYLHGELRAGRARGPFVAFVVAVHDDGSIGARYDEIDTSVFRALAEL